MLFALHCFAFVKVKCKGDKLNLLFLAPNYAYRPILGMQALHGSASIKPLKTLENASMFYNSSFSKRIPLFWKMPCKGTFALHGIFTQGYLISKYYYYYSLTY